MCPNVVNKQNMRNLFLLSFLFLMLSATAQFTLEQALSNAFPSDLIASQEVDKIAWVYNKEGQRNIWIAKNIGSSASKVTNFTHDDGQAISNLIFKENTKEIIFVRGGAPNRKGEIPNPTSHPDGAKRLILKVQETGSEIDTIATGSTPTLSPQGKYLAFIKKGQVWLYNFNSKKEQQLFKIRGNAGSLRWSPDGEHVAFVSNRGTHSFVGIYNLSKEELKYIAPTADRDGQPVWSPDGQSLAFLSIPVEKQVLPFMPRRTSLPFSIWRHDLSDSQTRKIWIAKEGAGSTFRNISATNQLIWTKDNHIVFPYEGNGWTNLWRIPASGGEAKNLTPGEFEVQYVSSNKDHSQIYYSSNQNDIDRQHIWMVTPTSSPQQLTNVGIQWSPAISATGQVYALASTGTIPAFVAGIKSGFALPIVTGASMNYPKDLVEPEPITFKATDGMTIHGQLFKPSKMEKGKKYPAVLFFHGGSRRQMLLGFHHRGYYHNAYALNQYLASQGYIVLSVNYRSGIGYGMKFREAIDYGAMGASEYQDVEGAGLYLKNRPDVDGAKIGLWGGSYGGYLTALGLVRSPELFAAGVDIHGVHDWNVVVKNFVPNYNAEKRRDFAKLAYESSPMADIENWKAPVLLIHGDDDRNVPFSETVDLVEALRRQGVYFEQLVFPDEVHGFLLHKNWVTALQATADFFDRQLK